MLSLQSAVLCAALLFLLVGIVQAQEPVFDIPRIAGITIDGNAADWGERGFQVNASAFTSFCRCIRCRYFFLLNIFFA